MRFVYFCTSPRRGQHAGGVKVIYDHSRQLNSMGHESYVMHERRGYTYPWCDHPVRMLADRHLRKSDHVILPEIKAGAIAPRLKAHGIAYSIFVQNGYYLHRRDSKLSEADVDFAYRHADYLLSISEDSSRLIALAYPDLRDRIIQLCCTVDTALFHPHDDKAPLITYMPRKNGDHAEAVMFALRRALPMSWEMRAIDGMPTAEVARMLRRSRIFLSFSGLEGLGLPPIEAALSGNFVIGYHGGGGREYWTEPNFQAVEMGDIAAFVAKVTQRVARIEAEPSISCLAAGIARLQSMYCGHSERRALQRFTDSVMALASVRAASDGSRLHGMKLQKRRRLGWRW